MGKLSREKGKRFERWVANEFRDIMPGVEVRRGLQSRNGGEVPDVEVPCFWVECKHGKKPNIRAALEQAQRDSEGTSKFPTAIIKDHGQRMPPMVVMRMDDWLAIIEEWYQWRGEKSGSTASSPLGFIQGPTQPTAKDTTGSTE